MSWQRAVYRRLHDLLHALGIPFPTLLKGYEGSCAGANALTILSPRENEVTEEVPCSRLSLVFIPGAVHGV